MKIKNNLRLFSRFFFGIATENERKEIFESEESQEMLQQKWNLSSDYSELDESDKNRMLFNIKEQIYENEIAKNNKIKFFKKIQKYAAIFLIGSLIGGYFLYQNLSEEQVAYITFENPKGETSVFILPDGSKVRLNAESKLVYPSKFDKNIREIKLQGEAYFEVTKDVKKPFIVKTSEIEIKVLGTSFNVSAFPNEETIEATLVTGKISISDTRLKKSKKHDFVMYPNHNASFNIKKREFVVDKVDTKKYISWTEGKLIFEDESFSEIKRKLERKYNVKFVSGTELLNNYKYNITITDESIESILNLLQKTTPIVFKIENDSIYISKKIKN